MPTPATRIPDGAVTGEDMRLRPYIKRKAAIRYVAPMVSRAIPARSVAPIENWSIISSMRRSSSLRHAAGKLFRVMVFCVSGLVPARLEHREHSIGDRKAAGGIARAE